MTRGRREVPPIEDVETDSRKYVSPERTSLQWLEIDLKSRTHEKRGWLRDKLLHHNLHEATEGMWLVKFKGLYTKIKAKTKKIQSTNYTTICRTEKY